MHDVMLLIQHLSEQEETTIKMILDCLYDVGSVNLINQKFQNRPLNQLLKAIAWMPKPVFRVFALRWFKKNCPRIITNWLHSKVSFKPRQPIQNPGIPPVAEAQASALTASDRLALAESDRQIRQLRSQVRILTGLLMGISILLGSALIVPNPITGANLIAPQKKLHSQP
ncbi:hypothetical protein K9N68_16440 [Kovacikia minuta CCNUW1]|uniref:hypothetical protein n=1 Tax=Kovacikia minuta TaxID=2931930 RepID=UPI001CCEA325|nr:hypothetical protein [Kovacikia minuta]UBF29277.1 hypothetical protein K9N68_16440 [Kovacikia minuta CCNUW1]